MPLKKNNAASYRLLLHGNVAMYTLILRKVAIQKNAVQEIVHFTILTWPQTVITFLQRIIYIYGEIKFKTDREVYDFLAHFLKKKFGVL